MTRASGSDSGKNLLEHALGLAPAMELEFPLAEYQRRRDALRAQMEQAGIDVVFLSSPEAMCWLTGDQAEWYQAQSSSHWPPVSGTALHVNHDNLIHFDSQDHIPRLAYTSILTDVRWIPEDSSQSFDLMEFIVSELAAEGWLKGTVGLELGSYRPNYNVSAQFQEQLRAAGATIRDATGITREVRRLKSPLERQKVRTAHRIGMVGLDAVIDTLAPGVTELEVYGEMIAAMSRVGGEVAGITQPVISGLKTLSGHALSSRKIIQEGEIIMVDICGVYARYHANIARTLSIGEPHPAVQKQSELAQGAFALAAEILYPGMLVNDFVAQLEQYYRDSGIWNDRWYYGGYEIGIAFPPDWVGQWLWECGEDHGDATFEPGLVINMESMVVLPESAGRSANIDTIIIEEERVDVLSQPSGGPIVV